MNISRPGIFMRIAMAFAIMAFTVAVGTALLFGVALETAIYRGSLAAAIFGVMGGILSLVLSMFFVE